MEYYTAAVLQGVGLQAHIFPATFALARPLISAMPGFGGLRLRRSLERPDTYLLLVGWRTLEDHTVGFRGSPEYMQWRDLLHGFYEPFPVVEHFAAVGAGGTEG